MRFAFDEVLDRQVGHPIVILVLQPGLHYVYMPEALLEVRTFQAERVLKIGHYRFGLIRQQRVGRRVRLHSCLWFYLVI